MTKAINRFYLFAILSMAILLVPNLAVYAQDDGGASVSGTSIAIVDVRALLTDSKAAKSIQSQIDKKRDGFLKDLAKEEKSLREMEKDLIESKDSVSAEDFAKKRKSFEEKLLSTRKKAEEERRNLEKAAGKASNTLRDEITKVVEAIVKEEGYGLVLSAQNVVVGNNTLNITKDVMKKLNKDVSKISVN